MLIAKLLRAKLHSHYVEELQIWKVGHFISDSATLRPMVCCGSEVITYIILFTFLLLHFVLPVHEFLWKLTQVDSSLAGPSLRLFY